MKKLFLLALSAIFICSCSSSGTDENPNPDSSVIGIESSSYNLAFESTGGEETVYINFVYSYGSSGDANAQWQLTGGESWCVPSKTNGGNYSSITFIITENLSPDERNATFTIACGTVIEKLVITQKQKDALTVTSSKIEIDATGGVATIEVKANIDYKYEIDKECKDWISLKETRAMQTTTLKFDVAKNAKLEKREGTITIHSDKLSETITIIQAEEKPTITVTQNKFNVSGDGETIEVEINSNVDLEIIPEADWIRETQPRTISPHKKYFIISRNLQAQARTGEINITSRMYDIIPARITVNQAAASFVNINVTQKGKLAAILAEMKLDLTKIYMLKITGELNAEDFLTIQTMTNLKNLDIANANLIELPINSFYKSKTIENLILPNTLTIINDTEFYQSSLKSVTIPRNVKMIGEYAFCACPLKSINIPASVKSINKAAFKDCSSLVTITFDKTSTLTTIGGGEGNWNYGTEYYYGAFANCTSLTSVEIPASVEIIGETAFRNCSALASVTFENGSVLKTIYGAAKSSYYGGAFYDCTSLTAIKIPASVETIECYAFKGCSSLRTVTFEKGSTLKTIGSSAFFGCPISSIEIPASVETINTGAFGDCSKLTTAIFEKGSNLKIISGYTAESWEGNISHGGVFAECTSLTSIEIPASVETINNGAFGGCTKLETITFESGSLLKTITGDYLLGYHSNYYYHGAFSHLKSLKTFDASTCTRLETIKPGAFYGSSELRLVKVGATTPPICDRYNSFKGINAYSVLCVPSESVDAYKYADGWKDFANFTELGK